MSESLFADVSAYSVLIIFITFFFLKRRANKVIQTVFLLACLNLTIEIISEIIIRSSYRGAIQANIYYIVQFLIISYLYRFQLLAARYVTLITTIAILFLAFFVIVTVFVKEQGIHAPQNWVWTAGNIVCIFYGILHINYVFKTIDHEPPIHKYGEIWISIAFLTYFTCSIGLFFLAKKIHSYNMPKETSLMMWDVHNLYFIIKNMLLAYAIYRISKEEERVAFNYKKYGEKEAWWEEMRPNPDRDKEDDIPKQEEKE